MNPKHFFSLKRGVTYIVKSVYVRRNPGEDQVYMFVTDSFGNPKPVYLYMGDMSNINPSDKLFADRIEIGDRLSWGYTGKRFVSLKKVNVVS